MKIRCPSCNAAYDMDEGRVPSGGTNIKCPKCKFAFRVTKQGVEGAPPAAAVPGSVPLPAPDRGGPAAAPPAGRPPGAGAPPAGRPPGAALAPPKPPPPPSPAVPGAIPLPNRETAGQAPAPGAFELDFASPAPPAVDHALEAAAAHVDDDSASFASGEFDLGAPPPPPPPAPAAGAFDFDLSLPTQPPGQNVVAAPPPQEDPFSFASVLPPEPPRADPGADMGLLDFVDEKPAGAASSGSWQVRRKSGKVFGPFDAPTIIAMLKQGQLFGNEDLSTDDGATWNPLANEPAFAGHAPKEKKEPPGLAAAGGGRVPPPMIPVMGGGSDFVAPKGEVSAPVLDPNEPMSKPHVASRPPRQVPVWVRLLLRRLPLVATIGAVLGVLALGAWAGLATDAGWFGINLIRGRASADSPEVVEKLAEFDRKSAEGTYRGWQGALNAASEAVVLNSRSEKGLVSVVLAASTLKRRYGTASTELDKGLEAAKLALDEESPTLKVAQAAVAAAGASPNADEVKSLLGDRLGEAWAQSLVAEVLLKAGQPKQAIDHATKAAASNRADHVLVKAAVQRALRDPAGERESLSAVLTATPGNARAKVWLARLELEENNLAPAAKLLDEALAEESRRVLDASEEALARTLRGDAHSQLREWSAAKAMYEKAAEMEPSQPLHRASLARLLLRQRRFPEALPVIAKALEASKDNVPLLVGAAQAYAETGDFVKASQASEQALKLAPNDPVVLVAAGDLALRLRKTEEARQRYAQALAKDPNYVPALVADGTLLLEAKDVVQAKVLAEKAVALAPKLPESQVLVGRVRLAGGELDSAKAAFLEAIAVEAELAVAHSGLADAEAAAGANEAALASFAKSVELDPRSAPTRMRYAALLRKTGALEPALAQLQAAAEIEPKMSRIRALVGAVEFDLGRDADAEKDLQAALVLSDAEGVAHDYTGRLKMKAGDLAGAVESLKRATDLLPDDAGAHYQLALAFDRVGRVSDAFKALDRSVTLDPTMIDAKLKLGEMTQAQGRFAEAIALYKKVLAENPTQGRVLVAIGTCEAERDKHADAVTAFRKALEVEPGLQGVQAKIGASLERLDNLNEAAKAFELAAKESPVVPETFRSLGYIYKGKGKRKDAIAAFEKYLAAKPDASDADEVKDQLLYLRESR